MQSLELFNPQSDQDSFRLLTVTLAATNASANAVVRTPKTMVAVLREGGLTRFETCPSGASEMGTVQRSTPGGTDEEAINCHLRPWDRNREGMLRTPGAKIQKELVGFLVLDRPRNVACEENTYLKLTVKNDFDWQPLNPSQDDKTSGQLPQQERGSD